MSTRSEGGLGRRELVSGMAAGAATMGAAAYVARHSESHSPTEPTTTPQTDGVEATARTAPIEPHGPIQAGITAPAPPQSMVQILVFTRHSGVRAAQLVAALEGLSDAVVSRPLGFDEPNDLTITLGWSLPMMRELVPEVSWPADLPTFKREELGTADGGDLFVQLGASSPSVLSAAQIAVLAKLKPLASVTWTQLGSRGAQDELGVFRNGMGFPDGIAAPRTDADRDLGVWLTPPGADSPWSGASFVVVRRLRVDLEEWGRWSVARQEESVGRAKDSGAPLSGGQRDDTLDLLAKYPDGAWKVPAGAHARRAFPTFVGRALMLRRSFGFANPATAAGTPDEGVLFVAYMRDPRTFVLTQQRLDELDDMMAITTCTASGAFFVPRGYTSDSGLGAWLQRAAAESRDFPQLS